LQGLAEKLLGKAFDELGTFKDAARQLNAALREVSNFKTKWYEKMTEAVEQSFKFNLNYAFTQTKESEALIDVELNLAKPAGQKLAAAAAAGDFAEILQSLDFSVVSVNPDTALTRKISKSAHLQINVLGWGFEKLSELIQQVEHAVQTEPNGLLHVFTIDTQIEQLAKKEKKERLLEEVHSNFLLRAVGETFQPEGSGPARDDRTGQYLVTTLNKMAVKYRIAYHDVETRPEELRLYLDLAAYLGLISDRDAFVRELQSQFPEGFDEVSVEYVTRYDDQTVRNAFTLSGDELKEFARQTVRRLLAAKYTGMREKDWLPRVGFAYSSQGLADIYYREGFTAVLSKAKAVTLPSWFTHGVQLPPVPLTDANRHLIVTLYNTEKRYVERLDRLDLVIDRALRDKLPVPLDELAKAAREFVGMADDLEEFGRANAFFLAFDKLTQTGSSGKWRRESAMVLTIKAADREPVVKYLMA
jgi:hypothetical protein